MGFGLDELKIGVLISTLVFRLFRSQGDASLGNWYWALRLSGSQPKILVFRCRGFDIGVLILAFFGLRVRGFVPKLA